MKTLTKKDIQDVEDRKTQMVDVPEWGGKVFVKTLSGSERDKIESRIYQESKDKGAASDIRAMLVVAAAVDGAGKKLFDESDIKWLSEKSAIALDRVADVARVLAGMMIDSIDDAEKNLGAAQSDDLSSG